jgi:Domain of unknown function (DUF3291)
MHLAQLNVARLRAPEGDPQVADFFDNLLRINQLGDDSPGFVWRLQDDSGVGATDIKAWEDPLMILNLTVWESVEALKAYAYRTEHVDFFKRRLEFFEPHDGPHLALWWIREGEIPTVEDAIARLEHLAEHGPSARVFTFSSVIEPAPT